MEEVGDLICRAARSDFDSAAASLRERALALTARFPIYQS